MKNDNFRVPQNGDSFVFLVGFNIKVYLQLPFMGFWFNHVKLTGLSTNEKYRNICISGQIWKSLMLPDHLHSKLWEVESKAHSQQILSFYSINILGKSSNVTSNYRATINEYMEHENDRNKDKCLYCHQLKAFALGHEKLITWFSFWKKLNIKI